MIILIYRNALRVQTALYSRGIYKLSSDIFLDVGWQLFVLHKYFLKTMHKNQFFDAIGDVQNITL